MDNLSTGDKRFSSERSEIKRARECSHRLVILFALVIKRKVSRNKTKAFVDGRGSLHSISGQNCYLMLEDVHSSSPTLKTKWVVVGLPLLTFAGNVNIRQWVFNFHAVIRELGFGGIVPILCVVTAHSFENTPRCTVCSNSFLLYTLPVLTVQLFSATKS